MTRTDTRRISWILLVNGGALFVIVLAALMAGILRPGHLLTTDFDHVLHAPSVHYPLGTDKSGRDLLALVLRGLRVSLTIAGLGALLSVVLGSIIGVLAGALGGIIDAFLMRFVDFVTSQNHLLFTLMIAVLVKPVIGGGGAVLLAVGLTHWTSIARILRSEILSLKERPFTHAAIGLGLSRRQLVARHYIPHVLPSAVLSFVLMFPHAIFHEAALSFLGFGLPPDQPSLGTLVAAGQKSLVEGGWWMVLFPGLGIVIAAVTIGNLGEYWRQRNQSHRRPEVEL